MSTTQPLLKNMQVEVSGPLLKTWTVDEGEMAKSALKTPKAMMKRAGTTSVDGSGDKTPQRSYDNTPRLRKKRKKAFFRPNVSAVDLEELADAAPAVLLEEAGTSSRLVGLLYVVVSTIFFSLAAVAVKLNSSIPSIETGFFRSIYSVLFGILLTTFVYGQQPLPFDKGKGKVLALLIVRGLTDFMASNLFYFGCTQLGLGLATVILFTNPFWAAILAKFWLGEPYGISDFALACFAFFGVVMSAWPALHGANVSFAMILVVFPCSVLQACTYCLIKRIAGQVHFMQMTVAYGFCGLAVGSAVMGYGVAAKQSLAEPAPLSALESIPVTLLNLLVAALAIGAQIFLNLGCARIEATVAALIRTVDIPLALIFEYFVFGVAAKPLEIAGACIVLIACFSLTAMKQLKANKEEDANSPKAPEEESPSFGLPPDTQSQSA